MPDKADEVLTCADTGGGGAVDQFFTHITKLTFQGKFQSQYIRLIPVLKPEQKAQCPELRSLMITVQFVAALIV